MYNINPVNNEVWRNINTFWNPDAKDAKVHDPQRKQGKAEANKEYQLCMTYREKRKSVKNGYKKVGTKPVPRHLNAVRPNA